MAREAGAAAVRMWDRVMVAWLLYDFANSSFSAIVQATIFPAYYATAVTLAAAIALLLTSETAFQPLDADEDRRARPRHQDQAAHETADPTRSSGRSWHVRTPQTSRGDAPTDGSPRRGAPAVQPARLSDEMTDLVVPAAVPTERISAHLRAPPW